MQSNSTVTGGSLRNAKDLSDVLSTLQYKVLASPTQYRGT